MNESSKNIVLIGMSGVGTDGGTIAFSVQENNWLGEGKIVGFDLQVDEESLAGTLKYVDPNYDFLGNAINYYLSSSSNDKPDQGYENTIISSGVGTSHTTKSTTTF